MKKDPIQGFNLFQVVTQILNLGLSSEVALSRSLVSKLGPRVQLPIFSEAGFQKETPIQHGEDRVALICIILWVIAILVPTHNKQQEVQQDYKGGIGNKMKDHENDDQIIKGELGSSCSSEKLVGSDFGLHQFLLLEPTHTKQRAHIKH